MSKPAKTALIFARVDESVKRRLGKAASKLDLTASDIVRELVCAYLDGRATIIPPDDHKEKSIYAPRK